MPIYDVRCEDCDKVWESFQKMSDPLPACPACGSEKVRKVLSAPGIAFKGGGWARDGYAKGQPKKGSA